MKTLREGGEVKLQHHIGGVHFVSINSGYKCDGLQKFYQPYNSKDGQIKPTKIGVALRFDEWATLSQLVDNINTAFPSLASVRATVQTR